MGAMNNMRTVAEYRTMRAVEKQLEETHRAELAKAGIVEDRPKAWQERVRDLADRWLGVR